MVPAGRAAYEVAGAQLCTHVARAWSRSRVRTSPLSEAPRGILPALSGLAPPTVVSSPLLSDRSEQRRAAPYCEHGAIWRRRSQLAGRQKPPGVRGKHRSARPAHSTHRLRILLLYSTVLCSGELWPSLSFVSPQAAVCCRCTDIRLSWIDLLVKEAADRSSSSQKLTGTYSTMDMHVENWRRQHDGQPFHSPQMQEQIDYHRAWNMHAPFSNPFSF
jgi:hypothetical protein